MDIKKNIFLKYVQCFTKKDLGCFTEVSMVKHSLKIGFKSLNQYFARISWTLCSPGY